MLFFVAQSLYICNTYTLYSVCLTNKIAMNNISHLNLPLLYNPAMLGGTTASSSSRVGSSSFVSDFGSHLSANLANNTLNKLNHLTKSFYIVMENLLHVPAYNASFLNTSSLTSQQATDVFIADLIQNIDQSMQNVSYSQISSHFLGATYQSFSHTDSNNYLQDVLISITASLDSSGSSDALTVTQLKNSFNDLLLSQGLPMNSIQLQDVLKGMSVLMASQMGNVGHLIDTNA